MQRNLKLTLAFLSILAVAFASGYALAPSFSAHKNPTIKSNVFAFKDGVLIGSDTGNVITDIGENFIGNCTIGLENNSTWSISLTNVGSPVDTWTQLDTEVAANGFTRAAATGGGTVWVNSGDWAINFTKTFTATGTQQLQTAGLNWDSTAQSNNNLFACAAFTQTTFNDDDTLTITWTITYNAND